MIMDQCKRWSALNLLLRSLRQSVSAEPTESEELILGKGKLIMCRSWEAWMDDIFINKDGF